MKLIGKQDRINYWLVEDQVWTNWEDSDMDEGKWPADLRWECSKEHFDLYRCTAYKFVQGID